MIANIIYIFTYNSGTFWLYVGSTANAPGYGPMVNNVNSEEINKTI